ncbi:TonB-dependent siderophore receptor [Labrys portucalensis]|uniref:TonB-dependent siderophore receptor n=1 Tax=Labrys neptuniae TaxID=376174 RepID=A0ABV6ZHB1_9HYPH
MNLKSLLLASVSLVLAPGAVHAQSNGAAPIELDPVVVEGKGRGGIPGVINTTGYVATSGRSATKTDTPLLEVPQSVSTVTQPQLEERKPQNLLEAIAYTPGAVVGMYGFDSRYDGFMIRGIDMTNTGVFRDGLRQLNSPNGLFRLEPYGVEAISILRGPAASIYGASSTGGIVDIIFKRPTETPFREIELQTGSFGRLQGNFDLSGPLDAENTVFYRLTGVIRNASAEISAGRDDRVFIAPAITWKPNDKTKLTVLGEYMDSTVGGTQAYLNTYAPYVDGQGNVTDKSTGATRQFVGDRRYNDFRQQQGHVGYEFEHKFSDALILRQNARYSQLGTNQEYYYFGSGLTRESTAGFASDTSLESHFATGPVEHTLLTGLDTSYLHYRSGEGYGGVPLGVDPPLTTQSKQTLAMTGIYIQDQVKWQNWRLTLGSRHDWLYSRFSTGTVGSGMTQSKSRDTKFTGRAALSYVTDFGLAPYVAYGTSFTPNPGTVLNGSVATPTTGEQTEIGVKYDIPNMNASLRAAVFDMRQNNAVVYEVVDGLNKQVQLDVRSRGVEIEGVASLTNGLSVQASYSYNDARILKLTPDTEGNRLSSVPYHMASLWLDYAFQEGPATGLSIGGGVRYVGSSLGDNLNRAILENKPRTFVDASVRYDLENINPKLAGMRVQVSATNLLNEVKQVCTVGYCYFDEGRKVIASLRYRW